MQLLTTKSTSSKQSSKGKEDLNYHKFVDNLILKLQFQLAYCIGYMKFYFFFIFLYREIRDNHCLQVFCTIM